MPAKEVCIKMLIYCRFYLLLHYLSMFLFIDLFFNAGLFYGCRGGMQKTTKEFLLANRHMSFAPVSLSMLSSFMSAVTLLGMPTEVYMYVYFSL